MLAADEMLHHVQVIREAARTGPGAMLFEQAVYEALAGQVPVNGKTGLAVLVFTPEGKPASRANSGLVVDLELVVRVVENKSINDDTALGTGISCEDMLLEVMLLLQMWTPLRGHPLTIDDFYKVPLKDQDHLWAWECVVKTEDAAKGRDKCSLPKFTEGDINLTITTATAEADIYYTLDGSLPTPASTLYEGPIETPFSQPTTVRAMAWKDGHRPSDCAQVTL